MARALSKLPELHTFLPGVGAAVIWAVGQGFFEKPVVNVPLKWQFRGAV